MIDPHAPDYTHTPVSPRRPHFHYAPARANAAPRVTVITPFYNAGAVLHETARSVFGQSLQQWEWLIVNDGSTDPDSLALLESYRGRDLRVRVIDHDLTRGLSAARHTGVRAAQTEFIVLLECGDLLEPTALEKWVWFLHSHRELAFVGSYSVGFGAQEYLSQEPRAYCIRRAAYEAPSEELEAERVPHIEGATIPEYLYWHRDDPRAPTDEMPAQVQLLPDPPNAPLPDELPFENRLHKNGLRLLLIVPFLNVGGSEKFNLDLMRQLTERGWEISLAATVKSVQEWLPRFASCTPDLFILDRVVRLADVPRFLRYLIRSRQVDVVLVSHSVLGYELLPYLRAHCPDVTFADYCHIELEDWRSGGYPRLAVDYQELLDLNIVSSQHLQSWMVRHGADAARIRVCYTNIDPEEWRLNPAARTAVRQEFGLDESTPVILYVARLDAQKQPRVLAESLRRVNETGAPFAALVAGDGPELAQLREWIAQYGLQDRVKLLGAVPNSRVRELMAAADIFFLPSQWEGIALSIYEAMASGLAVVGADVGGQRELVTPECGFLISRSDPETEAKQYAELLHRLLNDPEQRRLMGEQARARVTTHFRLEQMGERMRHCLDEARQLHDSQPRIAPSLSLGRVTAAQAVESARLNQFAAQILEETNRRRDWIRELEASIAELERGKSWLEDQLKDAAQQVTQAERVFQQQQAWIAELEGAKRWLEEERARLEQMLRQQAQQIEERERMIQQQAQLIEERERVLQEQQAYLNHLEGRARFRMLTQLGLLPARPRRIDDGTRDP